jgi:hypothetical protein
LSLHSEGLTAGNRSAIFCLPLADVYSVIGYYLHQKQKVDAYLARREKFAEKVRRQNEARFDQSGMRERLLARKKN